jgi:triosephosphate isomerase
MDFTRPLIVGNWKMFGLEPTLAEARTVADSLAHTPALARVGLCVPATLIERMARTLAGSGIIVGGQDNHPQAEGPFTGDVSAEMLADAGARLVIVAHSERRACYNESDSLAASKTEAALRAGLEPIVCVGETLAEREAGRTLEIIERQVQGSLPLALSGRAFALAYEPVWAIGSGLTPSPDQIEQAHAALRQAMIERLGETGRAAPILYGGSVKPANAADILAVPHVGGALVGGASLNAEDFLKIIRAAG